MLTGEKLEKYKEALKKYYHLKYSKREDLDIHDRIFMTNLELFAQCHKLEL